MFVKIAGWLFVATAIVTLTVFTAIRISIMFAEPAGASSFDIRYILHPDIALLHIVPGMVFLMLAPLQFITAIRRRSILFHRVLGRVLVATALLSGLFALAAGFRFPAFGGIVTQSATIVFGSIFLYSLCAAIWHIRHKRVSKHREWMIRSFALAVGVATIRLVIVLFQFNSYTFEEAFGPSFWIGFGVNLMVAEFWIRHTRAKQDGWAQRALNTKNTDSVMT